MKRHSAAHFVQQIHVMNSFVKLALVTSWQNVHENKIAFNVSSGAYTGCLKKMWTYFENAITPSFMKETFPNFLWL